MDIWQQLNDEFFSGNLALDSRVPVAGGDISDSFRVENTDGESFFIKVHRQKGLLEAEYNNLLKLDTGELACPQALGFVSVSECSALILPFLELRAQGDEALLGQQLALMHGQQSSDGRYGLDYDNYIGASIQVNCKSESWAEFWWQSRLLPQLRMAKSAGLQMDKWQGVKSANDKILASHQPPASLLHGDLWGGNKAYLQDGTPIVFDPATYYGDRETDIAFTRLFGGFNDAFYRAYQQQWPLPAGWQVRQSLYNLYHLLNHLNLFGTGYLNSVRTAIDEVMELGR
ncbi:fructosamine kinase family protein [Gilvimarinus sp. DA14]|uniref:fructosamine kinase family protein n=1 Tax=Gilvimarinus sp. DA14 TaxID=2956798 RepID=UPI0020B766C8|nr:fructosamine kinase family protein [Gilvimarinus sp. DA14]UTF59059.1 fructosamine kinase family protein [Gilvimarinus sp. DA14]